MSNATIYFSSLKDTSPGSKEQALSRLGRTLLTQLLTALDMPCTAADALPDEWGKPQLAHGIGFNIAHSGNIAICALGRDMQIGMDVEEVQPVAISLYRDHFTAREWVYIHTAGNAQHAFYELWTRKEAVIKAIGRGVLQPLDSIDVCDDEVQVGEHIYHLQMVTVRKGYIAHIATDQPAALGVEERFVPLP